MIVILFIGLATFEFSIFVDIMLRIFLLGFLLSVLEVHLICYQDLVISSSKESELHHELHIHVLEVVLRFRLHKTKSWSLPMSTPGYVQVLELIIN